MTNKLKKEIKRTIRNQLQTYILFHMYEHTIYCDKSLTCEEVGEEYINAMTELITEYINDQNLHLDYMNR